MNPELEFRLAQVELRDGEDAVGEGSAVISRIGVVDSYGDVIEKGAFSGVENPVPLIPNHGWDAEGPPIGLMDISEEGENVVGKFRLNMDLQSAKDWLSHLKFAEKQEFSIGFKAEDAKWLSTAEQKSRKDGATRIIKKVDLFEVSMVLKGAMPKTKLLELRSAKRKAETKTESRASTDNGIVRLDGLEELLRY